MASSIAADGSIPLTAHEALSGIFGSITLAAWIFLLVPQLYENYRLQSAEGISLTFLCIWFVGDITNLIGAVWAKLVPTVVAIAVYFCFLDVVLILQCLYYNWRNSGRLIARRGSQSETPAAAPTSSSARHARHDSTTAIIEEETEDDEEPLLSRRESHPQRANSGTSSSHLGHPGSHVRRRSSAYSGRGRTDSLSKILEEPVVEGGAHRPGNKLRVAIKNGVCILLVCAVGTAGWAIAWKAGLWHPVPPPEDSHKHPDGGASHGTPVGAEVLGYISAIAYLGARVPQIWKNWKEKSCEGLALLFFMLSLLGNLSYGAGILCHSLQKQYVITNVPWLIGSLGTMVEDAVIFIQFHIYGDKSKEEENGRLAANGNGTAYGATDHR